MLLGAACSGNGSFKLRNDADSIAYIIGLNIGENLLEMDSTLNIEAVCGGIRERYAAQARMTGEEAQAYYLRYTNYTVYEKIRAQEERFLDETTARADYKRTDSGLRYQIGNGGSDRHAADEDDLVTLRIRLDRRNGITAYSSYDRNDTIRVTLRRLPAGLQEGLRMIGQGGSVKLWIPASLGFAGNGCRALGIEANETLYCEAELLDVESGRKDDSEDSNEKGWDF